MSEVEVDLAHLLSAWALPPGVQVERARWGTNNSTWIVRLSGGRSASLPAPGSAGNAGESDGYVLRVYENVRDPAAIVYEHRLLEALAGMALSFRVPAPVRARSGETIVQVGAADGAQSAESPALAALFPMLPGEHPQRGDPAVAAACGAALGELDEALAALDTRRLPDVPGQSAVYAELARIHPLVPDPLALPAILPVPAEEASQFAKLVARASAQTAALYARQPRQIIHSDFGTSNVLMAAGRVTAVLDFEFAEPDLRAMDWAVGLLHSAFSGVAPARLWANLDAYGQGYAGHVCLSEEEVVALPALLRLRCVVSVIHRAGRWRQGVATAEALRNNLRDALDLDEWLRANERTLVAHALAWQKAR